MNRLSLFSILALCGCSTVVNGLDQTIQITNTPANQVCQVSRGGHVFGSVSTSKNTVEVTKSNKGLKVACGGDERYIIPTISGASVVGFLSVTSTVVDAATGAASIYPEKNDYSALSWTDTSPGNTPYIQSNTTF